jgi:alkylation response protein AidB-like acyl-CoA dehydrogenase
MPELNKRETMFIDLTPEQHRLRLQVRDYFNSLMTQELRQTLRGAESGDEYRQTIRQMGRDGWLAVGWPKTHGGQGLSATEQLIFFEEANIAGAPLPFVTISTVGPALMEYGSERQKEEFLPGIAAGETIFAIGYSEPQAGSDLATLATQASLDGDLQSGKFVVNGSKLWTSGIEAADFVWLAVRSSPELSRHKGISILIADTSAPGFSHTLIQTVGNVTSATYYDNVEVPAHRLVGELHGGWKLITSQLNHERLGLGSWSDKIFGPYKKVLMWAKARDERGNRAVDQPWVRRALAECYSRMEAMRLINFRIAADLEAGAMDVALASTTKVFGSESVIEILRRLMDIVGSSVLVRSGSSAAYLLGELEYEIRSSTINTFGGGTNEIQRELIAQFGLKMPRSVR